MSEIIGKDSPKGKLIRGYIEKDPLRRELFNALSDARWHSTMELWRWVRRVGTFGQQVGLVRVGKILAQFQNIAGEDVLERREGLDISEWRISPVFISLINDIVKALHSSEHAEKGAERKSPDMGEEGEEEDADMV